MVLAMLFQLIKSITPANQDDTFGTERARSRLCKCQSFAKRDKPCQNAGEEDCTSHHCRLEERS